MGIKLSRLPQLDLRCGFLEDMPLACVLGTARVWNVTGVLTLARDKVNKEVYFLEGLPVYCKSGLSGESLRQVMYKAGKIDHEMLEKVQQRMELEGVEEDRALLELGLLDENTRYFRLQEQARKRIITCFAWAGGTYSFEATDDFLDRIDLFGINPLKVIYEGITSHQVLDLASLAQEASSEPVVASEIIYKYAPFIEQHFPEANPSWPVDEMKTLGEVLHTIHPDISEALKLAFIMLAAGGLLLDGKRPGEECPPPLLDKGLGEEETYEEKPQEEADMEVTQGQEDEDSGTDLWGGDVESPSLEEEDGDVSDIVKDATPPPQKPKPIPPRRKSSVRITPRSPKPSVTLKPKPALSRKPRPARAAPRKKPSGPPPSTPPWKKARITAAKAQSDQSTQSTQKSVIDPDLERRFSKMLDMVRRGNPFETLNIGQNAQRAEIKKAYFYRHNQYHPDTANALGEDGKQIIDEIQKGLREAYDVMLDVDRRYEYEMGLAADEKNKAWSIELRKENGKKQWSRGKWYLS